LPWRVGIDEAGYGPNLGPLVMTAVACRVPEESADADLWKTLKKAVRRHYHKTATRLMVDDSKLVYSTAKGLADLEHAVLGILQATCEAPPTTVGHLAQFLQSDHELTAEAWFVGSTPLPLEEAPQRIADGAVKFRAACQDTQIQWVLFRSVIVCPPRFNVWLTQWGSKGTILSVGLVQLLNAVQQLQPEEPINVTVDKHGGRNCYGAALQEAFPDGWALPLKQGMDASVYAIQGLSRPIRITFRPRADSGHFEVALASMISKYVREALMHEFNAFWKQHVPDLQPTAGYPGDSVRFFDAIRPALARLNIAEELVWRRR
jgi:ribonuclease HII